MDTPATKRNDERTDKSHTELVESITLALPDIELDKSASMTIKPTISVDPEDEQEVNLPLLKALRRYPRILGYFLCLTIISIGWGFDLVIIGSITAVRPFQMDYGQYHQGKWIIPALWLSLWSASTPIGMVIGSISGGVLQDRIGRRLTLMAGSIISAVAVAIIFCSYLPESMQGRRVSFFIGKVIQGFSGGMLKATAITYVSETSPLPIRASAMGLFPMGNLLGQLIGAVVVFLISNVESDAGYLGAFGSQWILAIAPFILSCVMPESPAYLMAKCKNDEAITASHRLFSPRTNPTKLLDDIRAAMAEERAISSKVSYSTCFSGKSRRRTLLVVMVNFFPSMFGLELLSKSSYFAQTLGMPARRSLIFLIAGIVAGCIANLTGMYIVSRQGRRIVTLTSLSATAVLWVAMGVSGVWAGSAVYFIACGLMTSIIVVCGLGVWPAVYAITGEASSLQLRAKTQAIGQVVQQAASVVMQFVLPYIFNPDAGNLGVKTGFVYAGLCVLAVVLTWFFLPEMKGRSILEIEQMFNLEVPAREFRAWQRESADQAQARQTM
ncbi:MFS transporter fmqE-like protein [Cladobotryum mycophilum]|uniref:MFS transporter fmqE-like protein n=1 Tax=Cladobotryum mycophilum TaxID=491253 RepID=A0ABR0T463_9HYPO